MEKRIFNLVQLENGAYAIIHSECIIDNKTVKLHPNNTIIKINKIITDDVYFVDLGIKEGIDLYCNNDESVFYLDNNNNKGEHLGEVELLTKEELFQKYEYTM